MTDPTVIDVQLLAKQRQFIEATEREVGYSGAYGAGKTRALCLKALTRAVVPGAREALVRKHLVSLKRTTLKTLLETEGGLPPVLPPGSYSHNKQECSIRINGGGEIIYFGMDDPDKIGSVNVSGVGIDEVVELAEADYTQLRGRIRLQAGIPNQIYWACNPGPPSHFIARRFGLARGAQLKAGCLAIETRTDENTFLPPDYVADVSTLEGVARERFFLGKWVGGEGLVYDKWDRNVHLVDQPGKTFGRWLIFVDDGYTNPFAASKWGVDGDGRIHCVGEVYERGLIEARKLEHLKRLAGDDPIESWIVDPAAADLKGAMRNEQMFVPDEVDKNVFDGIQGVQKRLAVQGDGLPRLTVSPECPNVAAEFETYEWRKMPGHGKSEDAPRIDEPKKESDHHMDAIRYGVRFLDNAPALPRF